jgi:hypothetical protein
VILDRQQLRELANQAGLIFIGTLDFNERTTQAIVADARDPHRRMFLHIDLIGPFWLAGINGRRPMLNVVDPLPPQVFGGP